jgi:hypothetical protein
VRICPDVVPLVEMEEFCREELLEMRLLTRRVIDEK